MTILLSDGLIEIENVNRWISAQWYNKNTLIDRSEDLGYYP